MSDAQIHAAKEFGVYLASQQIERGDDHLAVGATDATSFPDELYHAVDGMDFWEFMRWVREAYEVVIATHEQERRRGGYARRGRATVPDR